jgi:hypothetical protein
MEWIMGKRIVLGVVLAGLIGILVAGAIVRTVDKTGGVAEARGLGQGRGGSESVNDDAGQGYRGGEGASNDRAGQSRRGSAQGQGSGTQGSGLGTGQAEVDEWLTIQGTVVSANADALVVQAADGQQVVVENRPWWFAQEQGFSTKAGDQVTLTGFYEGEDLEVGQISDGTNGQTAQIREESGRPLWAGRGRRGG